MCCVGILTVCNSTPASAEFSKSAAQPHDHRVACKTSEMVVSQMRVCTSASIIQDDERQPLVEAQGHTQQSH